MVRAMIAAAGALWLLPLAALGDYNLDGSKWHQTGLADIHFTSILYSTDALDQVVNTDCSNPAPFDEDGNPATIGMTIDVGAITGGKIPFIAHPTGTLDVKTGALYASETRTGLNIPFTVTVPNFGTYTFVLTSYTQVATGTVTGHDSIYLYGQWRDPGLTLTSDPATTTGVYKGYIDVFLKPAWTMTINNVRTTSAKCERPGVTILGLVNLDAYIPDPSGISADFIVRNGSVTETSTVTLGPSGDYSITTNIPGPVDVLAKASHWLRCLTAADTTNGNVDLDMTLLNGDADGNNKIALPDLSSVLADFGSTGSPADLDGSGTVGIADLSIVLANFNLQGAQ